LNVNDFYYNGAHLSPGVCDAHNRNYNVIHIYLFTVDDCQAHRVETLGFTVVIASDNQPVRLPLYRNCTLAK
jgi:hypothetical protein